jgi:NADH-quinone oxidoreductase subunit J
MVLFIFVIMLLNLPREDVPWARRDLRRIMLALVLAGILLVELILVVGVRLAPGTKAPAVAAGFGTTEMVGRLLFSRFLFPFEITSVILLVAIIGALVLAKKHFS